MEAGYRVLPTGTRLSRRELRHEEMERPLHASPARGAHDLLRLGPRGARPDKRDSLAAGLSHDESLTAGGTGATAYASAMAVYLAMGVNRTVSSVCSLVKWNNAREQSNAFSHDRYSRCFGTMQMSTLSPAPLET